MSISLDAALSRIRSADLPAFLGVALDSVHSSGHFGDTPLHIAAIWGDLELAEALLNSGANIDAQGEHDFTPLHEAISQGHPELTKFLISQGANLKISCEFGTTIELAHVSNKIEIMEIIRKAEQDAAANP